MLNFFKLSVLIVVFGVIFTILKTAHGARRVEPTRGSPWPQPKKLFSYDGGLIIRPAYFQIKVHTIKRCRIINEAVNRYNKIISSSVSQLKGNPRFFSREQNASAHTLYDYLPELQIHFSGNCESVPYFRMIESYRLEINTPNFLNTAVLASKSVWGILRGLETFSQLIIPSDSDDTLIVRSIYIEDEPRFSHRGLLIDTSRHYLPVEIIKKVIEAMEYNKMNVLHWHIVDDDSFPYQSETFPELSENGAYDPNFIYSISDISSIIDYASLRGVRVMPEFDTPGHTLAWGYGRSNLLTKCYNLKDEYGPIDPTNDNNYIFLKQLFAEVLTVFKDKYLHLGGDEVDFSCWKSNPQINHFMETLNITGDYAKLESYYIKKVIDIVQNELQGKTIVWQEVFDNGVQIFPETVVHIWVGNYEDELAKVTNAGHEALLSTCWYLDHLSTGGDWKKFYTCEPLSFNGTEKQKEQVIGGEACMWGEVVDETNVLQRIWPRASATAEKLWSQYPDSLNISLVQQRMEEHACRMKRRGIPAQPPNSAGFCVL